jgi:hypothetical protein
MGLNPLQLLLQINADPSQAEAAYRRLATTSGASIEQMIGQMTNLEGVSRSAMSALTGPAGIAAGVITGLGGALFAAAEHAAHYGESIRHAAEISGATTEQISTLHFAADRLGVSTSSVDTAVRFLSRNLGQIAQGAGKNAAKAFADLGINVKDSHGHMRTLTDLLPEVVEHLARMEAGGKRTADAMALLGRGGSQIIPMLAQFAGGFKNVEDQARAVGQVLSEQDTEAAERFLVQQRQLTAELNAFSLVLGRAVMPALEQLTTLLSVKLQAPTSQFTQTVRDAVAGLFNMTQQVLTLGGRVGFTSEQINKMTLEIAGGAKETQAMTDQMVQTQAAVRGALQKTDDSTHTSTKVGREYNDVLAQQLQRTQELVEQLESDQLPARQRIQLEIQRQIDAATREINKSKELAAQGKITHAQLATQEKEYTDLVALLGKERTDKLLAEDARLEEARSKRDAARIKHEINERLRSIAEIQSGFTTIEKITQEADDKLQSMQNSADIQHLAAVRASIEKEITSHKLFGRNVVELRQQLAATFQKQESIETKAAVQKIQRDTDVKVRELQSLRDRLLALATTEAQRTAITKQAETTQAGIVKESEKEKQEAISKTKQEIQDQANAFAQATHSEKEAVDSLLDSLKGVGDQAAELIKSKKAQAYVEGAFDVAKAIEEMAIFIASGGTDANALLASVKYGLAAAEYFKVAGRGSAGTTGGGATAGKVGGAAGPVAAGAMGSQVPMQPGLTALGGSSAAPGGTLRVIVTGPAEAAAWLAGTLNNYTQRQGGQLISSSTINPPKAGR